ncbi:MAG: hypothetical protein ACLVL7_07340 [Anaerotruncus massiliensis (ex Togo et al. 2019)]
MVQCLTDRSSHLCESLEALCCVYESYTRREVPFDILPEARPPSPVAPGRLRRGPRRGCGVLF